MISLLLLIQREVRHAFSCSAPWLRSLFTFPRYFHETGAKFPPGSDTGKVQVPFLFFILFSNDPSLGCYSLNNICYNFFGNTGDLKFSLKVASFLLPQLPCPILQNFWFLPRRNLQVFGDVSLVKWPKFCFKILLLTCFLCCTWISVINHVWNSIPIDYSSLFIIKLLLPF